MTQQIFVQIFIMLIPASSLWKIMYDYGDSQKKENPIKNFKTINRSQFGGLSGAVFWPVLFIMYLAHKTVSLIYPDKILPDIPEGILPIFFIWALYYPVCIGLYASYLEKLESKYPSQSEETVKKNVSRILRQHFLFFLFVFVLGYFVISTK